MISPVVLLILDGWGIGPPGPGNAISKAKLTHIPRLTTSYPHTQLIASGEGVGLPPGEDGNTETGHINIGAGRVVYQDLPRINKAIEDGSFSKNDAFMGAINYATQHGTNLHLMGLISDGAVHSKIDHLYALLRLVSQQNKALPVYLHLFTDGRDSPPKSAVRYVAAIEQVCQETGVGKIATIIGRYYAMDRDRRWERTEQAYISLTEQITRTAPSATAAIERGYYQGKTDEFIEPTIILDQAGKPTPRISEHDAAIFFNYRIDRPRQLTKAFVLVNFELQGQEASFDPYAILYYHKHMAKIDNRAPPFHRKKVIPNLFFVTMTEYDRYIPCTVAFPPGIVINPLGKALSDANLRQLRMSETEKERFVTYYFNGLREEPFPGEDRVIVPSVEVPTYDLQPAMSADEITEKLIDRLNASMYSFIAVNFANADMVAHTGNVEQTIKACEVIDACVGKLVEAILAAGGTCLITADHGNAEEMLGSNGEMDTEHSTFPVPLLVINKRFEGKPTTLPTGSLSDVAPSILGLLGVKQPVEMTGKNLLADIL